MKKLFMVYSEECDYDQFDEVIVIADDENEALEISKKFFEDDQGKIKVEEIKLDKSGVISTSYNAG